MSKEISGKRRMFLSAAIVMAVVFAVYFIYYRGISGNTKPAKKVTIASVNDLQAALVNLAFKRGYFKDEGLDVTLIQHTFGKAALKTMLSGDADFAAVGDTPLMFCILKGDKIFILSSIQNTAKATGVIALKDRGIASASDINGKTIGIPKGTTGDYFFYVFCMVYGIKYSELRMIDKKPEDLLAALVSGEVDAVSTWQQHAAKIIKTLSDKAISFQSEGIYTATFSITAKQDYVRGNPEIVEKVLAALYRAEQYARQDPEKSQEILADYCKIDLAMIAQLWAVNNFELTLDHGLINLLENETQWAIREKLTAYTEEPNYLDYVYPDVLKKIKPYAVTIIK